MARKDGSTLKGRQKPSKRVTESRESLSWSALGADTSMTAVSIVGVGYDAILDKRLGPTFAELRWNPEDDYFHRLADAADGYKLVMDVLREFLIMRTDRVFIAIEEPWFYGAVRGGESSWLKQMAEIAGAFKGGVARFGYRHIYEINNSQWHATLRKDGVEFGRAAKGASSAERAKIRKENKFLVKEWAIQAFGLPELPDLVSSKTGSKIVRPESGFGAKAKAVQPNDVYDAAACCAWMMDEIEGGRV